MESRIKRKKYVMNLLETAEYQYKEREREIPP